MSPFVHSPSFAHPVIAVAAFSAIAAVAVGLGFALLAPIRRRAELQGPFSLTAALLGHVALAYIVLAIGLCGQLRMPVLAGAIGLLALASLCAWPALRGSLGASARQAVTALFVSPNRALYWVCLVCLLLCAIGALAPSSYRDWDGLSEHLAQAKTYLRDGRIHPLWYDHHSQFPATMVMLYVLGLAFGGQGAAKLFHLMMGVVAALSAWRMARAHLGAASGAPALWIVVTTPLFLWLCTVGYVDLGVAAATLLVLDWLVSSEFGKRRAELAMAGLCLGAAMTIKMQGLFTLAVCCIAVAWALRRSIRAAIGRGAALAAIAVAVSCPWYIKSWLITGNPVYPFAYTLFGGKHWSLEQAKAYAYHHASFGWGKLPPEPEYHRLPTWKKRFMGSRSPLALLLAPFTLTLYPELYIPHQPRLAAMVTVSIGPMWLALVPLVALLSADRRRRALQLLALFAAFWLIWLETTQLVRYLLPWLILLAPVAGAAVATAIRTSRRLRLALHAAVGLWSVIAFAVAMLGSLPSASALAGPDAARNYLSSTLDVFAACKFLNDFTPPDAVVASYGEPRLFYLDREYFWADPGHSKLIAYEQLKTPRDLVNALARLGTDYILINQAFFGPIDSGRSEVHKLLADALDEGLLAVAAELYGGKFLILQVRPD